MVRPDAANAVCFQLSLKEKLIEIGHLKAALSLLQWDQQVNVPPGGQDARAATMAVIAGICHEKLTSSLMGDLLETLMNGLKESHLSLEYKCNVRRAWEDHQKAKKLPVQFIQELTRVRGEANEHWVQARQKSDFNILAPDLVKIVELKRREADYLGYGYMKSSYDALLDDFEPGITGEELIKFFNPLKKFLVSFGGEIGASRVKPRKEILRSRCLIQQQKKFAKMVVSKMGFDWNRGLLSVSAHPMCFSFHPADVRMSTRYKEDDFFNQCLLRTIHEAGHGLYDQGMRAEYFGTPMCDAVSGAIHESQSRMWENQVGRSKNFWKYFFPRLNGIYAFQDDFCGSSFEDFYAAINAVEPSLIRTDADEVTYNLHVIMRFEIEKVLIEGDIKVSDLPSVWNSKMREYLGVIVPNDAQGVLQDVHWSGGFFGYFPTYTLGNLYAAQFYATAKRDLPDLEKDFASGGFKRLLEWLRRNIHVHGRMYSTSELVQRVTGEPLDSRHFTEYIREKYSEIYQL